MQQPTLLVRQLKSGSKSAFNSIYHEYYEMLLYLSLQYVSEREDAKEAVQEAFVKLWENRATLKETANIRNFLYTIVKNNSLNVLKKQEVILRSHENIRWMEMHYNYEAMARLGFDSIEFKELKQKVDEAIENLPEHCRVVFKMSRFNQLKNREIAQKLNVSEKTVEAHMTKAMKLLKGELKPYLSLLIIVSDIFS
ncbi:MAG: RNA polymerase sigma-70 factor [Marinilabiliaceae bacterium]|nr:RNA polymerase sigma-70 factor [Marinilabiliaceae bacterium]